MNGLKIYYRCSRCGAVEAPHQIEPGDDFLPTADNDCECYMGPKWVRGIWIPETVAESHMLARIRGLKDASSFGDEVDA